MGRRRMETLFQPLKDAIKMINENKNTRHQEVKEKYFIIKMVQGYLTKSWGKIPPRQQLEDAISYAEKGWLSPTFIIVEADSFEELIIKQKTIHNDQMG